MFACLFIYVAVIYKFIQLLISSFTFSFGYDFIRVLTQSYIQSFIHLFTLSSFAKCMEFIIQSFTHSVIHSFSHSLVRFFKQEELSRRTDSARMFRFKYQNCSKERVAREKTKKEQRKTFFLFLKCFAKIFRKFFVCVFLEEEP